MTTSATTTPESARHFAVPRPNPAYERLHYWANAMRQLQPYRDDPQARILHAEARVHFKRESERLADERSASIRREAPVSRDAGKFAAAMVGGMEGLGGVGGAMAGAPLGPLGSLAGGILGMVAGRQGLRLSPEVSKEDLDATLEENEWFHFGGAVIGGLVGGGVRVGGQRAALSRANLTIAQEKALKATIDRRLAQETEQLRIARVRAGTAREEANRKLAELDLADEPRRAAMGRANLTTAEARAARATIDQRVAQQTEQFSVARVGSATAREEANRSITDLKLAEETRRLTNPDRPASIAARHQQIRAEAREAVANADNSEWRAVMTMQRAMGDLTPEQMLRLDNLGLKTAQESVRLMQMEQNLAAGTFKGVDAAKKVDLLTTRLLIMEQELAKSTLARSVAGEEAGIRIISLRERLKLLQQAVEKAGLVAESVSPGVTQLPL